MGALSARLFTWVQSSPLYAEMHRQAAIHLPAGNGRAWLDVGCGPGLLSRFAARHGYRVTGTDADDAMIAAASRLRRSMPGLAYLARDLAGLVADGRRADVVSASSLLVVLPDPAAGLRQLLTLLNPGGTLLVIEASPAMGWNRAWRLWRKHGASAADIPLLLWSLARGGRTLPAETLKLPAPGTVTSAPLLEGLATAWYLSPAQP